jgi:hypothetical protein
MGIKIVVCCILWLLHRGLDVTGVILSQFATALYTVKGAKPRNSNPTVALLRGNENTDEDAPHSTTTNSPMNVSADTASCVVDPLGSFSETADRANFTIIEELGKGQTGTVFSVRFADGQQAALKCSCVCGRFLLNDYGALLDLQPTNFVPKVWGYYKQKNQGDCYFMSLLGPSLRAVRHKTLPLRWPSRTIASLGLIMLSAIEQFASPLHGYVLHGDAFVGNLVLGPSDSSSNLSRKLFFIDFDLSRRKYIPRDFYPEVRQILYTLRFLYDGNESSPFFQILEHRYCHDAYVRDCSPSYRQLCEAIDYACTFDGFLDRRDGDASQEIDLGRIRGLLRDMLQGGEEKGEIFWPDWISQ